MKYKFIYVDIEESVIYDNLNHKPLYIKSVDLLGKAYIRQYYRIDNNNIEIIRLILNEDNIEELISSNEKNSKLLLLLDEINEENIIKLSKIYNLSNNISILAFKNNLLYCNDKELNILENIIFLKEYNSKVCIDSILLYLINNDSKEVKGISLIAGAEGDKDKLGLLTLNILKSCSDIYDYKRMILTLYIREEYSIEEINYIRDPLYEYMRADSKLIIKQLTNNNINSELYFTMLIE